MPAQTAQTSQTSQPVPTSPSAPTSTSPEAGDVLRVIRDFLAGVDKLPEDLDESLGLFSDGLALDSLEVAELAALLEDDFGTDPYTAGETPETIGQVVAFYVG